MTRRHGRLLLAADRGSPLPNGGRCTAATAPAAGYGGSLAM